MSCSRKNRKVARKVWILRHGEKVNFTFKNWTETFFDEFGNYVPKDLNLPETLPEREFGVKAYAQDPPLTRIGLFQAQTVGESLKRSNEDFSFVLYSSPSLRCIQTSNALLKALNKENEISINVEPGLYEFCGLSKESLVFMSKEELSTAGYNINMDYTPVLTKDSLNVDETFEEYTNRSRILTQKLTNCAENVFIVAHCPTLDVCSAELLQREIRPFVDPNDYLEDVPYCALLHLTSCEGGWKMADSQVSSFTHTSNSSFDYSTFLKN